MRVFKFSRPKGAGFGISDRFYVQLLSSKTVQPALHDFIYPGGDNGNVIGYGIPLAGTGKELLAQPLTRGKYGLASLDKKTVLAMRVLYANEVGYDPMGASEVLARLPYPPAVLTEMVSRVRATWSIIQFSFESHDPDVWPSIRFLFEILVRLGDIVDGVIVDPLSEAYRMPEEMRPYPVLLPISETLGMQPQQLIRVHSRVREDGLHLYTRGLVKFVLPEIEILGVDPVDFVLGADFLYGLAVEILKGGKMSSGDSVGADALPFEIRDGGLDRSLWEGIPCFELLPPTHSTSSE